MPRRPKNPRNLYQRGGIWYGRIAQPDGTKARVSSGLADRDAAILWRDREEQAAQRLASGGLSPQAAGHTVADALEWWLENRAADHKEKTRAMYEYAARCLRDKLGRVPVNALTREQVAEYLRVRVEGIEDPKTGKRIGTHARSTVLKERIALRAALVAAAERGLFVVPLAKVLPPFKFKYVPRRVFLRFEDFPRLLAELEEHRAWFVRLVVYSGAGHQEMEAVTWADDLGSHLRIPGTKTDTRDRIIPVSPELRAILNEVPAAERKGPLVEGWLNVNRDLGRACARAGIEPRVTCHDLRRTFGSWLAQRDVSTKKIGLLLGHAPGSKMADLTYSVLTDADLAEAVSRQPSSRNVVGINEKERKG